MPKEVLWILVSDDKYSLPILTGDTAKELAKKCGVSENAIKLSWSRRKEKSKYQKITIEEDE